MDKKERRQAEKLKKENDDKIIKRNKVLYNRLVDLPGIGEKTARRLILQDGVKKLGDIVGKKGISKTTLAFMKIKIEKKIPRWLITEIFQNLPTWMILVGSYRRMMHFSRDIDILVLKDLKHAYKLISKMPDVEIVWSSDNIDGDYNPLVIKYNDKNYKVDLFQGASSNAGSFLLHHTGSKLFNIQIRKYAKETLGRSLSQYGIKGYWRYMGFKTEENLFKYLRLRYIPPEQRDKFRTEYIIKKRKTHANFDHDSIV